MRGLLPDRAQVGKITVPADAWPPYMVIMWNQPYLETCCRAALHRLTLCGPAGRPPALKDGPCLERLATMGLACERTDGRYEVTDDGLARHSQEILGEPA